MTTTTIPATIPAPSSSTPTEHHRPWGSWQVLEVGAGFQVKRLTVAPGARLSLQAHEHRAEHWFVVSGTATCTVGDTVGTAGPGDHVVVQRRAVHRLANDRPEDLVVLEVQVGDYTGEDDIVRLQDDYGRS